MVRRMILQEVSSSDPLSFLLNRLLSLSPLPLLSLFALLAPLTHSTGPSSKSYL